MARPILRMATRLTPRTRTTAWAIAFACTVLVGGLSLVDGLRGGVDSVAGRLDLGPGLYLRGAELLESQIDSADLEAVPGDYVALRVHVAAIDVNGLRREIVVASLEEHRDGANGTSYPIGPDDLSLDFGLRQEIEAASGRPLAGTANLTLFGVRLDGLPLVPPPPLRPSVFPLTWAYVRPELLARMSPADGPLVQAILVDGFLDPSVAANLGLSRLEALGAIGFLLGSVEEAVDALSVLAVLIAGVIALLVYSAMSLEVHRRAEEIRTLRALGASPGIVASVYEVQAVLLALLGAGIGSALGIVLAHAFVSFAPFFGLPNLVLLRPPGSPVLLAFAASLVAAGIAGIVPSRRAALLHRVREVGPS